MNHIDTFRDNKGKIDSKSIERLHNPGENSINTRRNNQDNNQVDQW